MKYDWIIIGDNIRRAREAKGLSQAEFESLIKGSAGDGKMVGRWERAEYHPPLDKLMKICELCDCQLGYLLGEPGYKHKNGGTEYISNVTGLSPDAVNALRKYNENQISLSDYSAAGFTLDRSDIVSELAKQITSRTYPDKIIIGLISYMLTARDDMDPERTTLELIAEDIGRKNSAAFQLYVTMPETDREYIITAYREAARAVTTTSPRKNEYLRAEYRKCLEEIIMENKEEIKASYHFTDSFIEGVYLNDLTSEFDLVHSVLDRRESALDTENILQLIRNYSKSMDNLKRESLNRK